MLRRAFFAVAIALCCCIASDAQASILTLNLGGTTFSTSGGTINPNAIVMTFDDDDVVTGAADRVMLTIFFQGGVGVGTTAFIDDLVFNVDRAVSILFLSGALANSAS